MEHYPSYEARLEANRQAQRYGIGVRKDKAGKSMNGRKSLISKSTRKGLFGLSISGKPNSTSMPSKTVELCLFFVQ